MNVIEALQRNIETKQRKLLADYRGLLARGDEADPKVLQKLVNEMGISPAQVKRDARIIAREAELKAKAADAENSELAEAIQAAHEAWTNHDAETERLAREREAEGQRLRAEAERLGRRLTDAQQARRQLSEIRQNNPSLFGVEQQPAEEAISNGACGGDGTVCLGCTVSKLGPASIAPGGLVKPSPGPLNYPRNLARATLQVAQDAPADDHQAQNYPTSPKPFVPAGGGPAGLAKLLGAGDGQQEQEAARDV